MSQQVSLFITCPKGLEGLLLEELQQLGGSQLKETVMGVYANGSLAFAYRCCLWSRLANRVLLVITQQRCNSLEEYYNTLASIDWQQHFSVRQTFAINFSGKMKAIRHTHFGALKAKDAIADYFNDRFGHRPDVDAKNPDVLVNVRVARGQLNVAIDLSGQSLHKRGYRGRAGAAPLKENLAAALLMRADWPGIAARGGSLIDPMCGSGTLLIEAAMMFGNIALGLQRKSWGFSHWLGHDETMWRELVAQAEATKQQALSRQWPPIQGYDASQKAVELTQSQIAAAGLQGKVFVYRKALADLVKPSHKDFRDGLVISNAPYGERLGEKQELVFLYQNFANALKQHFKGWEAALFTGNADLGKTMGLRSRKQYALLNGAIPCKLLLFTVNEKYFINRDEASVWPNKVTEPSIQANSRDIAQNLSPGAQMFANRIKKNLNKLNRWLKQTGYTCYRIYDADMPEYAVAIDHYGDYLHVAEYAPPASVDAEAAAQRLNDVLQALPLATGCVTDNIVLKQRLRQRGKQQYTRQDESNYLIEVEEGQAKLLVNLQDYLDTGLFLDHRPVRLYIAEHANKKRFLNLFCYTATASVHAAIGGAAITDSVDLSATYLSWARQNFSLNGLSLVKNRTHQADVREWLSEQAPQQYDIILLDPPTFSNSKRMDGTLDIQRDHVELIQATMRLLSKDGLLIFSNNQKKFQLDDVLLSQFAVEDKTEWSLDEDFKRAKNTRQCWFISNA